MKKWEISMLAGVLAAILCCAAPRLPTPCWWTSAFSPLCGELVEARHGNGEVVVRSRLWELAEEHFLR